MTGDAPPAALPFEQPNPLAAMTAAHDALLDLHDERGNDPAVLAQIEDFIRRGQATGAWLDGVKDRRAAQGMLDFWASELYRAGQKVAVARLADFDPVLAPDLAGVNCPYVGLQAFDDDRFFFGREAATEDLLRRLHRGERLLAIVGPSGSGKSSVVFGGLLPKLQRGELPGSVEWRYATLVPGPAPMAALAAADPAGAAAAAPAPAAAGAAPRLTTVLVVDQFEEIFTLCREPAIRQAFTAELLRRADGGDIVVLTVRTDFEENIAALPAFQPRYEAARVELRPLTARELQDAIERPAAEVGLRFEDGVVQDLAGAILGVPGGLPLLQFTLRELWQQRDRNRVTREVYERVGSPLAALGRTADAFYASLPVEEQTTVERTLLKLVRPADSGTEFTRNRVPIDEIYVDNDARDRVDRVLAKLEAVGLVRRTGGGAQVEVVHEALVRNWGTLKGWLERERELLRGRFLLRDRARAWEASGRPDEEGLLRGAELADAGEYRDLDALESAYVGASQRLAQREEDAREAARVREVEQARRTARKFKALAAALAVAVLLAAVASIFAAIGWRRAESRELSARALVQFTNAEQPDPLLAAMLALAADDVSPTDESNAALRQGFFEALDRFRLPHLEPVRAATFLHTDGGPPRVLSLDSAAHLWRINPSGAGDASVAAEEPLGERVAGAFDQPRLIRGSPDGRWLILAGAVPTVTVSSLDGATRVDLPGHELGVSTAEFSADGRRILTSGFDGNALVWDWDSAAASVSLRHTLPHTLSLLSAHLSADGRRAVTLDAGGSVTVWDAEAGAVERACPAPEENPPTGAALSADGARLLTLSGPEARVIDLATCALAYGLQGHIGQVNSAAFSPAGDRLVTAGADGTARIWNARDGSLFAVLRGHDGAVNSAEFSPDGNWVITASDDMTAHVHLVSLAEVKQRIKREIEERSPCQNRALNPLYDRVCPSELLPERRRSDE